MSAYENAACETLEQCVWIRNARPQGRFVLRGGPFVLLIYQFADFHTLASPAGRPPASHLTQTFSAESKPWLRVCGCLAFQVWFLLWFSHCPLSFGFWGARSETKVRRIKNLRKKWRGREPRRECRGAKLPQSRSKVCSPALNPFCFQEISFRLPAIRPGGK